MFRDRCDPHHFIHAIGRRRGGRGFGPFAGFGPSFMGGDGFPSGRKLGADELQLVLLEKQPAHGYELIRMLEERSGGFYAPSPGMVYPALTYLDEVGQAVAVQEANRKLYSITDAGRAYLAQHREEADAILDVLSRIGGRMEHVREAFAGFGDVDPEAADELHEARHALKHALIRKHGCAPEEARRIARILARATTEILGRRD
jgi:DNA-binding PadR family transcriptional regulator